MCNDRPMVVYSSRHDNMLSVVHAETTLSSCQDSSTAYFIVSLLTPECQAVQTAFIVHTVQWSKYRFWDAKPGCVPQHAAGTSPGHDKGTDQVVI